jgi:hypothetical protein
MDQTSKVAMVAAAAGMALASAPASAEMYVGAGLGDGTIETSENFEDGSINFDESDMAYRIFAGYMFSQYLGVELAYLDLGSPSQRFGFDGGESGTINVDFKAELTGISAQGVLAYPIDVFEVFAKLGIVSYEAEVEARNTGTGQSLNLDDDGEELAYGIGAKYNIGNFALRADWDIVDAGDVDDVSLWTIGAELSF